MKDIWKNNTPEIKRILKRRYPDAKFRIRTKNYSGGKSIYIYTSLIKEVDYNRMRELENTLRKEGLYGKEIEEYREFKRKIEENQKIEREIKTLLKDFWEVDYDEFSGEVLQGANCFLFVEKLK